VSFSMTTKLSRLLRALRTRHKTRRLGPERAHRSSWPRRSAPQAPRCSLQSPGERGEWLAAMRATEGHDLLRCPSDAAITEPGDLPLRIASPDRAVVGQM